MTTLSETYAMQSNGVAMQWLHQTMQCTAMATPNLNTYAMQLPHYMKPGQLWKLQCSPWWPENCLTGLGSPGRPP
eukprot:2172408-Pyramimonas_sp.AAC.1